MVAFLPSHLGRLALAQSFRDYSSFRHLRHFRRPVGLRQIVRPVLRRCAHCRTRWIHGSFARSLDIRTLQLSRPRSQLDGVQPQPDDIGAVKLPADADFDALIGTPCVIASRCAGHEALGHLRSALHAHIRSAEPATRWCAAHPQALVTLQQNTRAPDPGIKPSSLRLQATNHKTSYSTHNTLTTLHFYNRRLAQ